MSPPADRPSPTFCVMPWVHVFADELGKMRPCCMAIGARDINNTDGSGESHVAYRPGSIEAGWNSPFMRDIRLDMLEGREPAACATCYKEERLGIKSYRESSNETFAGQIAPAAAATAPDGASPLSLVRSVDMRLGNLCNLKCRMCGPVSSRLLIPEWRTLFDVPADEPRLRALEQVNWFETDAFWANCAALLPGLDKLHFAGGEPLLITRMLDFLQQTIAAGHAGHIALSYVTNLTILPERVTTLWPAFKAVTLTGSLDGSDAVNSYIRFPSKWDRIDANIGRLVDTPAAFNCRKVTFNTTVQAYNVLGLADLFEYLFARCAPPVVCYPRLTLLQWPSPFSVRVLPPDLKALAETRLRDFVRRWQGRWPEPAAEVERFLHSIDGVIAHMHGGDLSAELPEFVRRTVMFDRMRDQRLLDVVPEFEAVMAGAAASGLR